MDEKRLIFLLLLLARYSMRDAKWKLENLTQDAADIFQTQATLDEVRELADGAHHRQAFVLALEQVERYAGECMEETEGSGDVFYKFKNIRETCEHYLKKGMV